MNSNELKSFWSVIEQSQNNVNRLQTILENYTKEELIKFQEIFVELSAELKDEPYIDYMEDSEDGIEDIANWIVSKGEIFYNNILNLY